MVVVDCVLSLAVCLFIWVCVSESDLKVVYFMVVSGFVGLNLVLFVVCLVGWLCTSGLWVAIAFC